MQIRHTFIDGDHGVLLYRGYPIGELAEHGTFLETCHLLLYGELPNKEQYAHFVNRITYHTDPRADQPVLLRLPP